MADGVEPCLHQGLIAHYVDRLTLRNVSITGQQGEKLVAVQAGNIEWEGEQ